MCNDSDSGDYLSENWRFALTELNSSYYMAVCIEDNSRGLYFLFSISRRDLCRTFFLSCSYNNCIIYCFMLQVLKMVQYH